MGRVYNTTAIIIMGMYSGWGVGWVYRSQAFQGVMGV